MLERSTLAGSVLSIGTVHTPQPIVGVHQPPQPQQFSYTALIFKEIKEDLGWHALCFALSLAGKWLLPKSCNISYGVPVYVAATALALTVINELSQVLLFPPQDLFIKFANVTIPFVSIGATCLFVKACHIPVSCTQGARFCVVVLPLAKIVHQFFEE